MKAELVTPLTIDDRQLCDGPITDVECLNAEKEFKKSKTPGTDGFSAEFYQFFWPDLRTDLLFSNISHSRDIDVFNHFCAIVDESSSSVLLKNVASIDISDGSRLSIAFHGRLPTTTPPHSVRDRDRGNSFKTIKGFFFDN